MAASSAALTLAEIKRYAKADLDEDGDNYWTTTGGDDSVINDYANRANRMVYREILRVNPGFFLTTTSFQWDSGVASQDITGAGLLTEEPQMIIDIEETPSPGSISASNLPRLLKSMHFIERPMLYRNVDNMLTASVYSWELQGNTLFIARVPTKNLNLHVHWVKQLTKFDNETDKVLGGFAEPYHDAVAACLAHLMNVKQEGENQEVTRKWMQWKEDIRSMASRRRNDGPKHVVKTRWR